MGYIRNVPPYRSVLMRSSTRCHSSMSHVNKYEGLRRSKASNFFNLYGRKARPAPEQSRDLAL